MPSSPAPGFRSQWHDQRADCHCRCMGDAYPAPSNHTPTFSITSLSSTSLFAPTCVTASSSTPSDFHRNLRMLVVCALEWGWRVNGRCRSCFCCCRRLSNYIEIEPPVAADVTRSLHNLSSLLRLFRCRVCFSVVRMPPQSNSITFYRLKHLSGLQVLYRLPPTQSSL